MSERVRCQWSRRTDEEREYHDTEWGVPLHDDGKMFEFLVLEGAQAGLSWLTILKRREHYRDSATDYEALSVQRNAPRWIKALTRFGFIPAAA